MIKEFKIIFHGKFIPLQGVSYIIRAAKILENYNDIVFEIIGKGQTYDEVIEEARNLQLINIKFLGRISYERLPEYLRRADIILGIFGDTDKNLRVIPNKVYEAIAMKKPVISADTPAIKELFIDRENILLCKRADPNDLAEKILELKNDEQFRNKIAENGYKLFQQKATAKIIGKILLEELKKI